MASTGKKPTAATQKSLFDDLPLAPPQDSTGVVRLPHSEGSFSPLQKKFNSLARKIEGLRKSIVERTAAYEETLQHWSRKVGALRGDIAESQTRLAFAIERQAEGFKLGVRQSEAVGKAITGLLDEAFSASEPAEDAHALFTRWNGVSFEEEVELQGQAVTEALSEAIRREFGVDIDAEAMRKGPAALEEAIQEALRKARGEFGKEAKPRKKTAKRIAKEEKERKAAEHTQKSLRSLYLSLVKILHPDMERDAAARDAKERTMKDLTAAYEAGDLHTLLRIEMEWMDREAKSDEPLPEEKLKAYIATLTGQAGELEDELSALEYSPRYAHIHIYLDSDPSWSKDRIDDDCRGQKRKAKYLKQLVQQYSAKMEKREFVDGIKAMIGD